MTLVVIRVVYSGNIPVSVTAPMSFEGETAKVRSASYVKELLARGSEPGSRVEFHVLPVGDDSEAAQFRSAPAIPIQQRVTVPQLRHVKLK